MHFIKRTILLIFTLGYLLVSGGILLIHTFCACADEEISSVYIIPEHCHHDDAHANNTHASKLLEEFAHASTNPDHLNYHHQHEHTPQDCEKSDYTLLKINNPYIDQQKLNFAPPTWVTLFIQTISSSYALQLEALNAKVSDTFVHFPPPLRNFGKLFILDNHRLKIPTLA